MELQTEVPTDLVYQEGRRDYAQLPQFAASLDIEDRSDSAKCVSDVLEMWAKQRPHNRMGSARTLLSP